MLDFLEYEEKVGRFWHRLVGEVASIPRFEEHAIGFERIEGSLPVFFRALGGDPGLELVASTAHDSDHRLSFRQRIGMERERLDRAERHEERILLPPTIACYPDANLNRQLYLWLAAFFSSAPRVNRPSDEFQADLVFLHQTYHTTLCVLAALPGFTATYADLAAWTLRLRPQRRLPKAEAAVEQVIRALLGETENGGDDGLLARVRADVLDVSGIEAPRGYRPFLPVPLWGEVVARSVDRSTRSTAEEGTAAETEDEAAAPKRAARQQPDEMDRNDPLALVNKGDLLMLAAEMVNVGRAEDEEKPDAAKKALGDMDQLTLGDSEEKISSPLRMDLDLAARTIEETRARAPITLPEWHYKKRVYLPDHCAVDASPAADEGEYWTPDRAARQRIRRVRRQFEAFRPRREVHHRQIDGVDLDMDALVRARTDRLATGRLSDKIYQDVRNQARDLSAAVLVDVSLSTDAWVDDCRALDVEKEALTALANGLDACGDAFGLWSFTSTKRKVRVASIKTFDEPLGRTPLRRISALKPGAYTRMGAAIRYVQQALAERPERHRLLLLLSDGKPHDIDHYDGRFGIEDTRKAIQEARHAGTAVFAITIDREASAYVPYLFGRGGYAMVSHVNRLVPALPAIYRQLVR
ncbi:MAG: nitric oxide reductase activation protein NorD [Geminicoccaceae bacterium]